MVVSAPAWRSISATRAVTCEVRKPLKDTSQEVRDLQTGVYRRLSRGERLTLAFELSVVARELAMSRLRRQHPDWSSTDLMNELLRYAFLPASVPEAFR